MRGFIWPSSSTLLVLGGGDVLLHDDRPLRHASCRQYAQHVERRTANKSVDAWVDGHAPKQANPFQPTMENIMDGSMTYDKNCAPFAMAVKEPTSS